MKIDPRIEREQVERVARFARRATRQRMREALERIETRPRSKDNLLPLILDAVKAAATVGEISDVLRGVWGEHTRDAGDLMPLI